MKYKTCCITYAQVLCTCHPRILFTLNLPEPLRRRSYSLARLLQQFPPYLTAILLNYPRRRLSRHTPRTLIASSSHSLTNILSARRRNARTDQSGGLIHKSHRGGREAAWNKGEEEGRGRGTDRTAPFIMIPIQTPKTLAHLLIQTHERTDRVERAIKNRNPPQDGHTPPLGPPAGCFCE